MIDVDILNTKYRDIITTFVFNTMLHHLGMLWIIENHEQLKYDTDIKIQIAGLVVHGITHLFVRDCMENCLRDLL